MILYTALRIRVNEGVLALVLRCIAEYANNFVLSTQVDGSESANIIHYTNIYTLPICDVRLAHLREVCTPPDP